MMIQFLGLSFPCNRKRNFTKTGLGYPEFPDRTLEVKTCATRSTQRRLLLSDNLETRLVYNIFFK